MQQSLGLGPLNGLLVTISTHFVIFPSIVILENHLTLKTSSARLTIMICSIQDTHLRHLNSESCCTHTSQKGVCVSMATIERNLPPRHKCHPLVKTLLQLRVVSCNPRRNSAVTVTALCGKLASITGTQRSVVHSATSTKVNNAVNSASMKRQGSSHTSAAQINSDKSI